MQLVTGKIHRDAADIVHCVDVELAYFAGAQVVWHEARVGLFDASEQLEVQGRVLFLFLFLLFLIILSTSGPSL